MVFGSGHAGYHRLDSRTANFDPDVVSLGSFLWVIYVHYIPYWQNWFKLTVYPLQTYQFPIRGNAVYDKAMRRHRNTITYLLYLLIYASVAVRGMANFYVQDRELFGMAAGLMLFYGFLLVTEGWMSRRMGWYSHLYFVLQTAIILILIIISPRLDYFALLFIPLSMQAMLAFPLRTGYVWIGVFALATAVGLISSYGLVDALPFIFIYAAAYLFVSSYATLTKQAEEARAESQTLLSQLQEAHEQLQYHSA